MDSSGTPVDVQAGGDPATSPRYYYVYDAQGDVVNPVDSSGAGRSGNHPRRWHGRDARDDRGSADLPHRGDPHHDQPLLVAD